MRRRILRPFPVVLLVLIALVCPRARAEGVDAAKDKSEFLRFVDDGRGGGKLETALATYRNRDGVTVHLVAAVHIADQPYYDGLNKTFKDYDAVLYEMVKPKNAPAPRPGEERSGSLISVVQRFMKDALDLQFQLDAIDYTRPNFVHADLDYETFEKMEEERGESIWTLMLRQMLKEMLDPPDNQPQFGLDDLMAALTSPDRSRQLKLLLGKQFSHIEDQMSGFGGTVLITERNKACFKALDKQIDGGKKDLGIFYGAGHMSDMEQRLLDRGFHKTGVEWRVAWDLSQEGDKADKDDAKPAPKSKPKSDADTIKIESVVH